jgi:hypothetical protein
MSQNTSKTMAPPRGVRRARVWFASAAVAALMCAGPSLAAPELGLSTEAIALSDDALGVTPVVLSGDALVVDTIALADDTLVAAADIGLEDSVLVVPDAELEDMRGRLLESEAMKFFGVRLASSWQGSDGLIMTAMIQLEVDFTAQNPAVSLKGGYSHQCDTCTDEAMEIPQGTITASFNAQGLGTVSGAVQSSVISGDDNAVRNEMRVRITSDSAPTLPASNVADITDTTTTTFSDGSAVEFRVGENSVGIALQGPDGSGVVAQGVNDEGARQIAQHVKLNSNYNTINNTLDVIIGIDQLPAAVNSLAIQNALSAMKGMGF